MKNILFTLITFFLIHTNATANLCIGNNERYNVHLIYNSSSGFLVVEDRAQKFDYDHALKCIKETADKNLIRCGYKNSLDHEEYFVFRGQAGCVGLNCATLDIFPHLSIHQIITLKCYAAQ